MGSDRARLRADVTQHYRRPIFQQGRVTLEADLNEAHQWIGEELEAETADIVGPCGTPDDGYLILETAKAEPFRGITFAGGTMYVGGLRVTTDGFVDTATQDPKQPLRQGDWLDRGPVAPSPIEYIGLHLIETEVSAVEDDALRESALGGPDTAQRIRLLHRIERRGTAAPNCAAALDELRKSWIADGLTFDVNTMRLRSNATLQVQYTQPVANPDLCEPTAHGGYFGAENQLIRVQITGGTRAGGFQVAWGFDNASFLYPITFADGGTSVIKLGTQPADAAHWPRAGQALELLQATARLANGRYVAAPDGIMIANGGPYDSSAGTITLNAPLTLPAPPSPQLFLRVWEAVATIPPGGAHLPLALGTTGIVADLNAPNGNFHVGDAWLFAVRPFTATGQQIVPARYTDAPQPPESAREWFCPLGIVTWSRDVYRRTADCRARFVGLVELTKRKAGNGCCTVSVSPEDLTDGKPTLQKIISALPPDVPVHVCLGPGTYELPGTLRIPLRTAALTIEGCPGDAILTAAAGAEASFADGLVAVAGVDGVTLRNLHFTPVPVKRGRSDFVNVTAFVSPQAFTLVTDAAVAIGVRAFSCSAVTIDRCTFTLPVPADKTVSVVAAGIFAGSGIRDVAVTRCTFRCATAGATSTEVQPLRIYLGYAQAEALLGFTQPNSSGQVVDARLEGAAFDDNVFDGVTYGVLVHAAFGSVRAHRNRITRSFAGFLFYDAVRSALNATHPVMGLLQLSAPYMFTISLLSRYPLPQGTDATAIGPPAARLALTPPAAVAVLLGPPGALTDAIASSGANAFTSGAFARTPPPPALVTLFRPEIDRAVDIELAFAATVPPAPATVPVPAFDIAHNDVLVGTAGVGAPVGEPALNIEFDVRLPGSELRLTANKLGATSPFTVTVIVYCVDTATVTGNEMTNYGRDPKNNNPWTTSRSFWLAPPVVPNRPQLDRVAITGNVFSGWPELPPRIDALAAAAGGKYPVGLADWYFLNTTMPVGELES